MIPCYEKYIYNWVADDTYYVVWNNIYNWVADDTMLS